MKISIIGAGNVGASVAYLLALKSLANQIVIVDVKEGVAEGKALDIQQCSPLENFSTDITGVTNNFEATSSSDIVVITSGMPRKPGMTRDDLIATNAGIVKSVTNKVIQYSPEAIIIVVANPLDVMTYCAHTTSQLSRNRVFGMAGVLDMARFRTFIAQELACKASDVDALLIGGRGDTMVPLPRYTTVAGIPITELITPEKLDALVQRTVFGGGEIVKLMGTSAYYAPASSTVEMIDAIVKDSNRILSVCVKLEGEYGIDDCYLSVPVVLGKEGIKKVLQSKLSSSEMNLLLLSREKVKTVMSVFDSIK